MKMFISKNIVLKGLKSIRQGFIEIVCPDKTYSFGDPESSLRGVIVVHDEAFFSRALFGGEVGFGDSYMAGEWQSPDLVAVARVAVRNLAAMEGSNRFLSFLRRVAGNLEHRRNRNTREGSRRNISYHYDLGNDFYRRFLGSTMAYSCGYFSTACGTLDQAQLAKFDRICRKLRLGPSSRVLEIGTGWGGFAIYAASHYGCHVTTTTISAQQHAYARDWVVFEGLSDRIELLLKDYRDLEGKYSHIVSIEMFEAVGYENYNQYFAACERLLEPGGTMLLQTITINEQRFSDYLREYDWIQKHIFPGAELASIRGILDSIAAVTNMSLYHAEDIGAHYARTLNAWREGFQSAVPDLPAMGFDDRFIRMWDYYLASCEGAFLERHIGDVQLVLTKNHNPAPLMDEPWEESAAQRSHEMRSAVSTVSI
jgi:cyclopropane-fatty-acyl-phospholipid synthase